MYQSKILMEYPKGNKATLDLALLEMIHLNVTITEKGKRTQSWKTINQKLSKFLT